MDECGIFPPVRYVRSFVRSFAILFFAMLFPGSSDLGFVYALFFLIFSGV
jgi:hypothetical protein